MSTLEAEVKTLKEKEKAAQAEALVSSAQRSRKHLLMTRIVEAP